MAFAGMRYRAKAINEALGPYGYVGRVLGRACYVCEPVRYLQRQGPIAVATTGEQPVRTLDPGECLWDALNNRIAVSPAYMLAKMLAANEQMARDRAYDADQAGAELREAVGHMQKLHFAQPGGSL